MLSLQCPSGVLKCFKSVRSFPLAFRASLVSFDAFISASVFVAAFAFVISALFCVYGEIHSSSSEASQAELCWKASAGLFLVRLLVCKCIFQASICWRFFFLFFFAYVHSIEPRFFLSLACVVPEFHSQRSSLSCSSSLSVHSRHCICTLHQTLKPGVSSCTVWCRIRSFSVWGNNQSEDCFCLGNQWVWLENTNLVVGAVIGLLFHLCNNLNTRPCCRIWL